MTGGLLVHPTTQITSMGITDLTRTQDDLLMAKNPLFKSFNQIGKSDVIDFNLLLPLVNFKAVSRQTVEGNVMEI